MFFSSNVICFLFLKRICGDTRQVKTLRFSSRVYLFTHESPLLPTSCNWPFVSPSPASPDPAPPRSPCAERPTGFLLTSHSCDYDAVLTASLQRRKPKLGEVQHVMKKYTGRAGSSNSRMQTFYAVLWRLGGWLFHTLPSFRPGSPLPGLGHCSISSFSSTTL